jgi:hypothetical protein
VKALVTGGYFDRGGDGVVWLVDFTTGRADVLLRWMPPAHLHVPTKGFGGGSLGPDGLLYVAAHAAVVRIDPRRAEVTGLLHQPCMNDLHHVAALGDRLYVANTGLGAVDVISHDGQFLGSHALLPAWANARRMGGDDFPSEAPPVRPGWSGESPEQWAVMTDDDGYHATDRHHAPFHQLKVRDHLHLNHVAELDGRLLATCFADGSLRDLRDFSVVARFEGKFLHDGVACGDALWLTAIDGSLIELDATTVCERRRLDTFATGHHGWCRGLAVTDDHLAVGLTQVRRGRPSRHPWSDANPDASETSVLLLDRRDGRLISRVNLTDEARHSKLYSVLPIEVTP